ncbi:MAG TPA: transposase [Streptosporangiaceae bacterium]|nr:transposase [Streptosporangiaceae bacterium]
MDAAEVLPAFRGIAVRDAWAPYDSYQDLAGHALCNAHALRALPTPRSRSAAPWTTSTRASWPPPGTGTIPRF